MAFVLILDCCILCDSVCSGPADYVNLMGEGRRYHNCSGCDTVVCYHCVCVVGWLEKYVLWRVQQSWRRWLAHGYRPCSDISTSFDHSLILNFGGQFLLLLVISVYELYYVSRHDICPKIYTARFSGTAKVRNLRDFSREITAYMHQISIIWAFFGYKWAN